MLDDWQALSCLRVSDTTESSYTVVNSMTCTATDPVADTGGRAPMLVVFGEHARELISSV